MNTPVDQVGLAPYWLLCAIASGVMMLADYWLTLWAAQPALRAGAVYELNPWLRSAVTAQRWFYGPFMAAVLGVIVMLGLIGSMVRGAEDAFLFYALSSGIIVTRLHLVILHVLNRLRPAWRADSPLRVLTVSAALLKLAKQQTALTVLWTLGVRFNRLPWLQPWLVGAAAGFMLMAAMSLFWHEIELRRLRRTYSASAPLPIKNNSRP